MPVHEILQLGNPTLRVKCIPLKAFGTDRLNALVSDLRETLYDFRKRNGFGRGIAAPQVGVTERIIFVHVDQPYALVNPVIITHSRKLMTLWDDCFSFPNLSVKVKRHLSIEVRFQDVEGRKHTLRAEDGLSELLQHEIDHINGILAIDRAIDSRHIIYKTEYEKWVKRELSIVSF